MFQAYATESAGLDQDQKADPRLGRLPREPIDRFTRPLARFLRIETVSGAVLLIAAMVAFGLSNSAWADGFLAFWDTPIGLRTGSFQFQRPLRDWINDGLMTFFFFVVALELKRELVVGELREPRIAALSIAAAAGGMLAPAAIYLVLQFGQPGEHGWGVVMATDTAFVIGCLALLGQNAPRRLRVFLLSLAVVDDIGAILVVAIGYSSGVGWIALAVGITGLAVVYGLRQLGIRSVLVYVLAGILIWLAIDASGIHPTVAGVALGLLTPTRGWVSDRRLRAILRRVLAYPPGNHWSGDTEDRKLLRSAGKAAREALAPVERLELILHPWVAFGVMPLFALANAGVHISLAGLANPVTLAVVIGFTFGKPVGILAFAWLAVRLSVAVRPTALGWGVMAGGGMLAGIGFTMALFIAELAFKDELLEAAKLGIFIASVISAAGGFSLLAWLGHRDRDRSAMARGVDAQRHEMMLPRAL
ncbi:Na+/H+ antiporter NhaA [Neoroseomonas soli]|uniref:Na(+)/H(+) antiporter NhaA n=1 Tax=Neoroseomonas soli TaxID=1081025 RepID=A0A9X9WWQ4_9PROT|nr:Na+/H+ antiporter NhaA [Neoroseomonas soli]MBR0671583.1 Na+/H+ antiporter NhaA [Neoroseomonas soli]